MGMGYRWALGLVMAARLGFAAEVEIPKPKLDCHRYEAKILGKNINYCLQRSHPELPAREGEPVVYFMHGIFGDVTNWAKNGYDVNLRDAAANAAFPPMTFVAFDTVGTSFFSDAGDVHKGPNAYETWFITEFVPYIEAQYHVCAKRACRALAGNSMGGLGAIKTALRHPDMFAAAAGNSPALNPYNVHDSDEKWTSYFGRHTIGALKGMWLLAGVRRIFTTRELSDANDPTLLTERFADLSMYPDLYLDVGDQDNYGFYEGYNRFLDALTQRHLHAETHVYPNADHGIFHESGKSLLEFLRRGRFATE